VDQVESFVEDLAGRWMGDQGLDRSEFGSAQSEQHQLGQDSDVELRVLQGLAVAPGSGLTGLLEEAEWFPPMHLDLASIADGWESRLFVL